MFTLSKTEDLDLERILKIDIDVCTTPYFPEDRNRIEFDLVIYHLDQYQQYGVGYFFEEIYYRRFSRVLRIFNQYLRDPNQEPEVSDQILATLVKVSSVECPNPIEKLRTQQAFDLLDDLYCDGIKSVTDFFHRRHELSSNYTYH